MKSSLVCIQEEAASIFAAERFSCCIPKFNLQLQFPHSIVLVAL